MSSEVFDVVVIGGGIVGAACAAECAAEKLKVAIVEARMIGGGATAAGMGHLVVMDDSEAQFALTSYSQKLWNELRDELPAEVEHDACGTIWVAADDDEMEEVFRKQRFYADRGVAVEVLDAHALYEAEPNLRRGLVGGLRVPGDSVIYPPCAAQFLVDRNAAQLLPQGSDINDLAQRLSATLEILGERDLLLPMAKAARALAKPDAAERVATIVLEQSNKEYSRETRA